MRRCIFGCSMLMLLGTSLSAEPALDVELFSCPPFPMSLSDCQPINDVEWRQGKPFVLGLRLVGEATESMQSTDVQLHIVQNSSSDGVVVQNIISDGIMQFREPTVLAHTDDNLEVIFKGLFLPGKFLVRSNLLVGVGKTDDSYEGRRWKYQKLFKMIRTSPLQVVGEPNFFVQETYPPTLVWELTYNDLLQATSVVGWYVASSDGITSLQSPDPNIPEHDTTNLRISIRPQDGKHDQKTIDVINNVASTAKCHSLVVWFSSPTGDRPDTISAHKFGACD